MHVATMPIGVRCPGYQGTLPKCLNKVSQNSSNLMIWGELFLDTRFSETESVSKSDHKTMPKLMIFDDLTIKTCPRCQREWTRNLAKHFGRNKSRADGLQVLCRECRSTEYFSNKVAK